MIILAFETSAKAVSTALVKDGMLLAEYRQNSGQTHSRTLMQMAEDMIKNCDLAVSDIDAVAAAAGPGSFTGIRIGVAAAKGFAWGRQLPCYGISTLEAMVRSCAYADGYYCCCMDARRQQVYNAVFRVQDGHFSRICEDRAVSLEALVAELKTLGQGIYLVGDGAQLCYEAAKEQASVVLLPEHLRHQHASGAALCAFELFRAGILGDGLGLTPNYIRPSQAERLRAELIEKETK